MDQKYATILELSKEFNVPKSTIYYYYQKGVISPEGTIGKAVFFKRDKAIIKLKKVIKV